MCNQVSGLLVRPDQLLFQDEENATCLVAMPFFVQILYYEMDELSHIDA